MLVHFSEQETGVCKEPRKTASFRKVYRLADVIYYS